MRNVRLVESRPGHDVCRCHYVTARKKTKSGHCACARMRDMRLVESWTESNLRPPQRHRRKQRRHHKEYCNTDDNSCGTGDKNDTGDNNNNTGNNISGTGYNNSVTDDSNTNSDTGCDSRCGVSDSGAGDGSGLSHSHCCNHKIYGVYETSTSSTGQSPGPASVPHKMRQAGHHDNLPPDQRTVS